VEIVWADADRAGDLAGRGNQMIGAARNTLKHWKHGFVQGFIAKMRQEQEYGT
jgi:hypothetical protein